MAINVRLVSLLLACVVVVSATYRLGAFALLQHRWPPGTINMEVGLGAASGLSDGSPSWDECMIGALADWNGVLGPTGVRFNAIRGLSVTPTNGDSVNSIFFSDTFFGTPFDPATLAVANTFRFVGAGVTQAVESDILFNSAKPFDCYNGPTRSTLGSVPENASFDLQRVGGHEAGHTLGLDHPDEHGQTVPALMNSSDFAGNPIDGIQPDDTQGVLTHYGVPVRGIPFPPRNEVLDFFLDLEGEYRDTLRRQQVNVGNVNAEGSAVWFPEWLRYVLNACSPQDAQTRVLMQIRGQGIQPTCGVVPPGQINFPARNLSLDFLRALDAFYRDELRESAPNSFIDLEGKAVWLQEYLRYRVNGCDGPTATTRVFAQIRGGGIAPVCAV